ncbi:MAG: ATP-binding cassette domain-containing protein [Gammaproteobacteria bacterium]|nr:ATP-binding cassette domain-containing protein [Gammaproteobacteria bacterium]
MSEIKITGLSRTWGTVEAVKKVSFIVPEKSFTVLLGPSGCGKSTLLRMISGLEEITEGSVHIGSRDVTNVEASDRGVSMVFQSYALFPHLSVKENIQFGLKVRRVPSKEREDRMRYAADVVGLTELLDRKPANLSGGQRQRVVLARSIVSEKSVCLMDEPLSNLDAKLRAEMRDQIRNLQQRLGITVVYVTHDQVEAMSMADQIVLLNLGEIVQIGEPQQLYSYPANVFAAQFVGVPPMNVLETKEIEKSDLPVAIRSLVESTPEARSIGVRPESIQITEHGFPVEVFAVDYFGGETVVRVRHLTNEFYIRVAGHPKIRLSDKLTITWDPEDTHLFDDKNQRI